MDPLRESIKQYMESRYSWDPPPATNYPPEQSVRNPHHELITSKGWQHVGNGIGGWNDVYTHPEHPHVVVAAAKVPHSQPDWEVQLSHKHKIGRYTGHREHKIVGQLPHGSKPEDVAALLDKAPKGLKLPVGWDSPHVTGL